MARLESTDSPDAPPLREEAPLRDSSSPEEGGPLFRGQRGVPFLPSRPEVRCSDLPLLFLLSFDDCLERLRRRGRDLDLFFFLFRMWSFLRFLLVC